MKPVEVVQGSLSFLNEKYSEYVLFCNNNNTYSPKKSDKAFLTGSDIVNDINDGDNDNSYMLDLSLSKVSEFTGMPDGYFTGLHIIFCQTNKTWQNNTLLGYLFSDSDDIVHTDFCVFALCKDSGLTHEQFIEKLSEFQQIIYNKFECVSNYVSEKYHLNTITFVLSETLFHVLSTREEIESCVEKNFLRKALPENNFTDIQTENNFISNLTIYNGMLVETYADTGELIVYFTGGVTAKEYSDSQKNKMFN